MADRRRINGPPGGTSAPIFASTLGTRESILGQRPTRERAPEQHRKICKLFFPQTNGENDVSNEVLLVLKTDLNPSASGSSYFEFENTTRQPSSLLPSTSNLKLICNVHGPKPLPRSAPFSPQLVLSTFVKFAPFAARKRKGWIRDQSERDLGAHLETALRGVIIGDRWPKSGVDVIITVLEGEEDRWWGDEFAGTETPDTTGGSWGFMTTLGACITAASAALIEAGIDCVDVVTGGVASIVRNPDTKGKSKRISSAEQPTVTTTIVLDPSPSEHQDIMATCVVGYLPQRDEITELWMCGNIDSQSDKLIDAAIEAARLTSSVLVETVKDMAKEKASGEALTSMADITMAG